MIFKNKTFYVFKLACLPESITSEILKLIFLSKYLKFNVDSKNAIEMQQNIFENYF